jgi:type I restriction enzyme M protein
MLDSDTKRRIDACRDILVGKVPDPKSQVEQITIALIYKFMDDMDAEAEELGGKRSFFAGEYGKYGWAKLMAPSMGGFEVLALYSEAIGKMTENPGIPSLFRDIFKNAYLPYRDPETLRSFLKEIATFNYDHSEKLGDAFEYLLSVLGSQGDAGQFRTPRHIIDFMVEVVAPQKHESILDPACGTAGFLISAWKHILKHNTKERSGDQLTPDQRQHLAANIHGYDISPDMVRLSLVNMYLHGFTDPHIVEYDTLTSEEKWNETADVILANPPFMSPKGGIKPHKRFSIQAKRSEVLFVDYMAEHLSPTGRAAIIVPEGIIFQSQTAYKQLREMLVKTSLVAVVSLPAGCFNPYSGVKTSILILDKSVARRSDSIAFFKVENDGFGLGAQRRAFDKNDLPQVQAELAEYLRAVRNQQPTADLQPTCGLIVAKEKIAANGEFNLSGERYREGAVSTVSWPIVELGEIIDELESGVSVNSTNRPAEAGEMGILKTSCVTSGTFAPEENKAVLPEELSRVRCPVRKNSIIISRMNTEALVGANAYIEKDYGHLFLPDRLWQTVISRADVMVPYVQHVLASREYRDRISAKCGGTSGSMKNIAKPQLLSLQIPLPPLEVQKEIVAEIEGYQKLINGARAVLDHYRPHIPIHPEWPIVALGDLCAIRSGGTPARSNAKYWNGDIPWVTTTLINYCEINRANEFITESGLANSSTWMVPKGTVLMAMYGEGVTRGRVAVLGINAAINQACAAFIPKDESFAPAYLYRVLQSRYEDLRSISDARGGNQSNLSAQVLKQYSIPLPPLATQQAIVAEIEAEQALVAANRELIARFEKKIQATLARIWGEAP